MNTYVESTIKRTDVVRMLKGLILVGEKREKYFYALMQSFSDPYRKGLFLKFWQGYAKAVAELGEKIRWYGGTYEINVPAIEIPHEYIGQAARDLIIHCANEELEAIQAYKEALKLRLPMDIRMLVQRQLLQCEDVVHQLDFLTQHPLEKEGIAS